MKKLSAVSFVLIIAISVLVSSCTASGKVTVQKQQNKSVVTNVK